MGLLMEFQNTLRAARANSPATMEFTIDGEVYYRNFLPPERLLILGGGNVSQALCPFAAQLGFSVTVADERPSFANTAIFPDAAEVICDSFPNAIQHFGIRENDYIVIVTRGHSWDADCLRCILPETFPKYVGMIGSRHRAKGVLNLLHTEGYARLDEIHTPIGLNIGALTVKEIAISILAELISIRRQNTERCSKNHILVNEEADLPLLEFLSDSGRRKTLLLVYKTFGSAPARSGALMAIDDRNQTCGTIGGGCAEGEALRQAFRLIGTGCQKTLSIDLTDSFVEREGMVCGGKIQVLLADMSGYE